MSAVGLSAIRKNFAGTEVIHGIDLQISHGEFIVFVGPSGCGKSTLLRMIAGLEDISSGELRIGDDVANHIEPARRGVAMVFQSYALYPHMTVFDNMAFGLKLSGCSKKQIQQKVSRAAESLQLTELLGRRPRQLSGGQRQRVAIGRAIVREPNVFLFDEPLSNLDAALRSQTRIEIAELHSKVDATMIYVTHDQTEAMTLADRIVVLRDGTVEQVGTPIELYKRPANKFVASFIGSPKMNFLPASAQPAGDGADISLSMGSISLPVRVPGKIKAEIGVRPEHLRLGDPGSAMLKGKVAIVEELGEYKLVYANLDNGQSVTVKHSGAHNPSRGDALGLDFEREHTHLFDDSGRTLARPAN